MTTQACLRKSATDRNPAGLGGIRTDDDSRGIPTKPTDEGPHMQQPHGHPISLDDLAGRLTITVPEAGQLLGCSRANAYQAARDGVIPTLQLGRRLVVPVPKFLELCGATQNAEAPGT